MAQDLNPLKSLCYSENSGMLYRLHAGYGFRIAGGNAENDGMLAQMDIAYRTTPLFGPFSLEAGSSLDFFGETEHMAAYLQLNYHANERWIISLRGFGGGVKDKKEPTAATTPTNTEKDTDDLGGIVQAWLGGSYRLDQKFDLGAALGMDWELYGKSGGDQGTQISLVNYLNLAYRF
jgi:hypothetical protein